MKRLMIILFVLMMVLFIVVPSLLRAQAPITISGTVFDAETGNPLEGCHVYLNERMGTTSAYDGAFTLIVPTDLKMNKVHFSFLGFNTKSLSVTEFNESDSGFEVLLFPDVIQLEELVFVADPMDDFRDAVNKLAYTFGADKARLAAAIRNELQEMDLDIVFKPENAYKAQIINDQ